MGPHEIVRKFREKKIKQIRKIAGCSSREAEKALNRILAIAREKRQPISADDTINKAFKETENGS